MVIKSLGDFTAQLVAELQIGTEVKVDGGYGRFLFERGRKRQLWVAGGVGVTPFLAGLQSKAVMHERDIDLVLCVRRRDDVFAMEELLAAQERWAGFRVHIAASDEGIRLNQDMLTSILESENDLDVYFCGPDGLRNHLAGLFHAQNIPLNRLHYEIFDMKGEVDVKLHLWPRAKLFIEQLRLALKSRIRS